ncbi:MAG TPA: hypothetical protein VGL81_33390 [Polyangiaceae bacterium]|jgi:hypothetical protein
MRCWTAAGVLLALGCNSSGSQALPGDGGAGDALADATTPLPDGGTPEEEVDTGTPSTCLDIDASLPGPSIDCVYGGHCPVSCSSGTASAYACNGGPDGSATYPAGFNPPSDTVDIVASLPGAYPWEAGVAYLSCAPLSCTRWATADHVDGGSAWPGDPCADGGVATQAWACPTTPGVLPTPAGCFNPGDLQNIGGPGTGLPVNVVWCCPPVDSTAGADGGGDDGGATSGEAGGDAASE